MEGATRLYFFSPIAFFILCCYQLIDLDFESGLTLEMKGLLLSSIRSKDPVIFLEPKALYRAAVEEVPSDDFEIPLGQAEIMREGSDVTIVTYGSMCRIVMETATQLAEYGVEVEVIDAQTLIPFDLDHDIIESIKKTNRLIVADEDDHHMS